MIAYCKKCRADTIRYSQGQCAVCAKASSDRWRKANPEKVRARLIAWRKANPEKEKAKTYRYRKAHPEKRMRAFRRQKYGVDQPTYEAMLLAQNGVCYVCQQPETLRFKGTLRALAVDHCHLSGRVRKLLCARCNIALGFINDDLLLLDALRNYIIEHEVGGIQRKCLKHSTV